VRNFRADMVVKGCRKVKAYSLRNRERVTVANLLTDFDTVVL